MHRIDNSTAVAVLPTPAAAGTPGFWTKGNALSGVPATIMDEDFFNAFQEELLGLVEAAGLTEDKADHAQLLESLRLMFAPRMQVFTVSGTFNVPAGVSRVRVRVWGGGGGGGGAAAGGIGAGGAAGGYGEGAYAVTPGGTVVVTIGARGAGGTGGGGLASGASGGTSSFGAHLSCTGGGGGSAAYGAIQLSAPSGGSATGADYSRQGSTPEVGGIVSGSYFSSPGGPSYAAPYGYTSPTSTGSNGNNAVAPGMGGSSGTNTGNGGMGGPGLVIVEW